MKTAFRWLKPILCFAMLVLLVSCATTTYIPTNETVGNMSVDDARKALVKLEGSSICNDVPSKGLCSAGGLYTITSVRVRSNRLSITDGNGKQGTFKFRKLPEIIYDVNPYGAYFIKLSTQPEVNIFSGARRDDDVANALYVLRQNAIKAETDSIVESDARFAASLADYRKKAASNAALPEETNRYKVQAEGALRDKEFDDAADFYAEALKIAPWWPVGHFNRALVLGETGEYADAKREMNYYLQLAPDAPNARAAQDKIYDWERLEAK